MSITEAEQTRSNDVSALLRHFSIEITAGHERSIFGAIESLPVGTETFIASLPKGRLDAVVEAACRLADGGLTPVPHIAARNLTGRAELESLLEALVSKAAVDRILLIAGDRDAPAGPILDSLQVLESRVLSNSGIRTVYLSAYPEGHPRISALELRAARRRKLELARKEGLDVGFISQFCFEPLPIVRLADELRQEGIAIPLRAGIAGPVSSITLLKYAALCGIGPSIRALRERQDLTKTIFGGASEQLLSGLAASLQGSPQIQLAGVHFFTFGAVHKTAEMLNRLTHG